MPAWLRHPVALALLPALSCAFFLSTIVGLEASQAHDGFMIPGWLIVAMFTLWLALPSTLLVGVVAPWVFARFGLQTTSTEHRVNFVFSSLALVAVALGGLLLSLVWRSHGLISALMWAGGGLMFGTWLWLGAKQSQQTWRALVAAFVFYVVLFFLVWGFGILLLFLVRR